MELHKLKESRIILLLTILGCISYLPFLGGVHLFDWDEVNFAEISREMIILNDYTRVHVNFEPFWEKPPLFFWLQVICMKFIGINEYAARLPNAIIGILTLITLFKCGTYYKNQKFGLTWALVYWGSILPHLYFRSGIIDPWFNFFIFLALFYYYKYLRLRLSDHIDKKILIFSGLALGIAVITKGQVAILLYGLCILVYYIATKFKHFPSIQSLFILLITTLLSSGIWLGYETYLNGTWFMETFTEYQIRLLTTHDAGHKGFFGYHFVVLLLGCFPASLFAILTAKKKYRPEAAQQKILFKLMFVLLAVVLVVFSIVQSKIVHYSSLAYFPLTFLAASGISYLLKQENKLPALLNIGIISLSILFALITGILPVLGSNTDLLLPILEKDPFAVASLSAEVSWDCWRGLPALVIVLTMLTYILWSRNNKEKGIIALFIGTIIFVNSILFLQVNNIEAYSQRALIEFCKEHADEDAYIKIIGTKSYAQLFYGKKKQDEGPNSNNQEWLLSSDKLDKDAYFIVKIHKALDLSKYPEVQELYRKNGFIFYKRTG